MGPSNLHRIGSIDPKNVFDEYKGRALGDLSDAEIFDQICPIVACPPRRGLTSFTLHAPLEAMARYGLMRLVHPSDRELARLHLCERLYLHLSPTWLTRSASCEKH